MKRIALSAATLTLAVLAGTASAMTLMPIKLKCPIGGESFTATLAMSGTQFGQNLDRRPVGAIAAPWPMAKCPTNGFVLFKEKFTAAEIKTLQPFVLSPEYQALQKTESNYFLISRLMEKLGASSSDIASALLRATWEVEKTPRYQRYASAALDAFEAALAGNSKMSSEERASYEQIAGELERRLGRFDAARTRLMALAAMPSVQGTPLEQVVQQELVLIAQRDVETHLAKVDDEKNSSGKH
ncbi:hypothetical protein [Cognatilysobacter terrigena]|uniref:hypothetical protein n=1 Tax=Cognatilysobacter terrigena TaxID=2488749 RepID=UPI00105F31CA|nr:hypothetical protein [Lysobacter terrigena]